MDKQALKWQVIKAIDAGVKEIINKFASLGSQEEYTEFTIILFY